MGRLRASVEAASAEAARESAAADAAARVARKGDLAAAMLVELERLKVGALALHTLQVPQPWSAATPEEVQCLKLGRLSLQTASATPYSLGAGSHACGVERIKVRPSTKKLHVHGQGEVYAKQIRHTLAQPHGVAPVQAFCSRGTPKRALASTSAGGERGAAGAGCGRGREQGRGAQARGSAEGEVLRAACQGGRGCAIRG